MANLIPRLFSYAMIIIVYMFIIKIIQMISRDIEVMSRKKTGDMLNTYLKLLNIRHRLDFNVSESYGIKGDTIIGRDRKCGISIDDPFMSQKHAEIILRDGVFYINDLGSTNGTTLNGKPIGEDYIELINGDKIEIGQLSFIFITENSENE